MLPSEDELFYRAGESVLVRRQLKALPSELDTVIFDIDGVLIDTRRSFSEAVCEAVQYFFEHILHIEGKVRLLTPGDVRLFKRAGGFNCDRDLAEGALLFFLWKMIRFNLDALEEIASNQPSVGELTREIAPEGGGFESVNRFTQQHSTAQTRERLGALFDRELARRLFLESYGGRRCRRIYGFEAQYFTGEGKVKQEQAIVDPRLLKELMAEKDLSWGIFSGRTPGEADMALEMLGIGDFFPRHAVVVDDGNTPTKPDPTVLIDLCGRLHTKVGIYVGDTIDDLRTVNNFRTRQKTGAAFPVKMEFCLCLTDHLDHAAVKTIESQGTGLIAQDVNALLKWLNRRSHKNG